MLEMFLSHLYELHLHNLDRLPDEMPDEFLAGKVAGNSCTSASASLANRLLSVHAREIFQVLKMCPGMAIWMWLPDHLCFSFRLNVLSDWSSCSIHLSAHYFSA